MICRVLSGRCTRFMARWTKVIIITYQALVSSPTKIALNKNWTLILISFHWKCFFDFILKIKIVNYNFNLTTFKQESQLTPSWRDMMVVTMLEEFKIWDSYQVYLVCTLLFSELALIKCGFSFVCLVSSLGFWNTR